MRTLSNKSNIFKIHEEISKILFLETTPPDKGKIINSVFS